MLYSYEKNSHFSKKFCYPTFFCNSQLYIMVVICRIVSDVNCTLCQQHECFLQFLIYQSSRKVTIIIKTTIINHLNCTLWVAIECWVANLIMHNVKFSQNCTTSNGFHSYNPVSIFSWDLKGHCWWSSPRRWVGCCSGQGLSVCLLQWCCLKKIGVLKGVVMNHPHHLMYIFNPTTNNKASLKTKPFTWMEILKIWVFSDGECLSHWQVWETFFPYSL